MNPVVTRRAYARAGLLGNPSDLFGGKTVAFTVANFAADVSLKPADCFEIVENAAVAYGCDRIGALASLPAVPVQTGASALFTAAARRFFAGRPELLLRANGDRGGMRMGYRTDIPRQVGLAGSSALIVATLRALTAWFGANIDPAELAEMALAAEAVELGTAAGPMDRVIQAYEGVVSMDFSRPRGPQCYMRIDPATLPPLMIAWDARGGEHSGQVHGDVVQRWRRGEDRLRERVQVFPEIVEAGLACLERGDADGFADCVDRNLDARADIYGLSERDRRMVECARQVGTAAKFCGSGGAILAVPRRSVTLAQIAAAFHSAGYPTVIPAPIIPAIVEREGTS